MLFNLDFEHCFKYLLSKSQSIKSVVNIIDNSDDKTFFVNKKL